jgi:mannosyltransferase
MANRFFAHLLRYKKPSFIERYFTVIVLIFAFVTMALSMVIGLSQSVWFDEGYSIMVAQRPLGELMALVAVDAHPPLYYLLLKAWMVIFGAGEFALRASSVLCGGLSLAVMAFLLKDLFSKRIALLTLPFLAFAPFLLRYNYEIRMYSLVMLIGLVATWVMVRAWRTGQVRWWVMYGLLVTIGMYTLYMSAVFWLAHIVWLLVMTYQAKKTVLRQPYWAAYAIAAILFLPWAPTVLAQLSSSALPPFMNRVTLYELTNILGLLMPYKAGWQIGPWMTVVLVAFIMAFSYVFSKVWQRVSKTQKHGLLLLASCFFVGILFYALISLPPNPPRFLERYVVHISIFWYALVGVTVAIGWQLRMKLSVYILTGLSVVVLGLGVGTVLQLGNYNFQRTQRLQAETIRQGIGCDDTTFVTAGPFGYIDMKYSFEGCTMKFYYPLDNTLTGGYAPVDQSPDRIKTTDGIASARIAYVYFDDSDVTLTPDVRFREVARRSFDKTHVIIYER